jgi:ABC-2 type transport system permease protein
MAQQVPRGSELLIGADSASLEVLAGSEGSLAGEPQGRRWSPVRRYVGAFLGAARMQVRTTLANIEDLTWVVTEPLLAIVAVAILVHAGRPDLASHALSASFLMTIGQMGFWVGSDVLSQERHFQTLELSVITPTPLVMVLFARILLISSVGLIGLIEGWLLIRGLFRVPLVIHHPWLLLATLLATMLAATGTSVLMAALFSLARSQRTLQNAVYGPLYLVGGVLVPVQYLPGFLQPLSPFVFLSWSAELVRDSFALAEPRQVGLRLAAILALGAVAGVLALLFTTRLLDRLRRNGTLGLS